MKIFWCRRHMSDPDIWCRRHIFYNPDVEDIWATYVSWRRHVLSAGTAGISGNLRHAHKLTGNWDRVKSTEAIQEWVKNLQACVIQCIMSRMTGDQRAVHRDGWPSSGASYNASWAGWQVKTSKRKPSNDIVILINISFSKSFILRKNKN